MPLRSNYSSAACPSSRILLSSVSQYLSISLYLYFQNFYGLLPLKVPVFYISLVSWSLLINISQIKLTIYILLYSLSGWIPSFTQFCPWLFYFTSHMWSVMKSYHFDFLKIFLRSAFPYSYYCCLSSSHHESLPPWITAAVHSCLCSHCVRKRQVWLWHSPARAF